MDGSDSQIHAPFKGSLRVQLQHLTNCRLAVRHGQTGETEPAMSPVDPVRFPARRLPCVESNGVPRSTMCILVPNGPVSRIAKVFVIMAT